jgi:uncharacterized surface protein with fasciclin (FAS1) repeats
MVISSCKNDKDKYYERPDWVAAPIYQQLQAKGRFTHYIECLNKLGFNNILDRTGYFTVFAPNDSAFEAFLKMNNYPSVNDIDTVTLRKIINYSIVFNAYDNRNVAIYQNGPSQNVNYDDAEKAYMRKTMYYKPFYKMITVGGEVVKVLDMNNNSYTSYSLEDNNNKNIPIFTTPFFSKNKLTSYDYNYFYPNVPFTGFNVADAKVLTSNIPAENGYIHEVDKVIVALDNIEGAFASDDNYSKFRKLIEDRCIEFLYILNITSKYQKLYRDNERVLVKTYANMAYNLNNEYVTQKEGFTLFAPDNNAYDEIERKVAYYYGGNLRSVPLSVLSTFFNSLLFRGSVWPSKFKDNVNLFNEGVYLDETADIRDAKLCSNGIFYGTKKAQHSDQFYTVYGELFLNPKYSMMLYAVQQGDLYEDLTNKANKLVAFLIPDEVFQKHGFKFNENNGLEFRGSTGTLVRDRLIRIVKLHFVLNNYNELPDSNKDGVVELSGEGLAETIGGEFIKYNNNTLYAAGNLENNEVVNAQPSVVLENPINGCVFETDSVLEYPVQGIGKYIESNPNFRMFFKYLKYSPIYTAATGAISGVTENYDYTFLIPTNEAMQKAISEGYLPADTVSTDNLIIEKIRDFLQYHIINKNIVILNGRQNGGFECFLNTLDKGPTHVIIDQDKNVPYFRITDMMGRTANMVVPNSNNLANKAILHQIDNYLRFK